MSTIVANRPWLTSSEPLAIPIVASWTNVGVVIVTFQLRIGPAVVMAGTSWLYSTRSVESFTGCSMGVLMSAFSRSSSRVRLMAALASVTVVPGPDWPNSGSGRFYSTGTGGL